MTMDILFNTMRMLHDAKMLDLSPLLIPANVKMSFLAVRGALLLSNNGK